jgi:nucleoside-diphosphate-sugar epimerase
VTRRVLVTGAGGFIGRWSLAPLRERGYQVCAVLSPHSSASESWPRDVEVQRADLLDARSIDTLIEAVKPTHLLHFAWIATPGRYAQSAENYRWLAASRHLLEAVRRAGAVRAVMAGSCAEYDWSKAELCDERTSPLVDTRADAPGVTPYAACKTAMQGTLDAFGRANGLSTAWGRIFFQYGPGEHRDRLVASVIVDLLSGREASCTHGRQVRSFLHVEDVGAAFAALLDSEVQGAVNVGAAEAVSIAELLTRLARELGRPGLLKLGARPAAPGEPAILLPAMSRLAGEVGFAPRWTLEAGLSDTVRWWRAALGAGPP